MSLNERKRSPAHTNTSYSPPPSRLRNGGPARAARLSAAVIEWRSPAYSSAFYKRKDKIADESDAHCQVIVPSWGGVLNTALREYLSVPAVAACYSLSPPPVFGFGTGNL
jgi:hypothetical protein